MKKDFPIFSDSNLVYLDSAATAQRPSIVIDAVMQFYKKNNATTHRALYSLGIEATKQYEHVRALVARFIGSKPNEIIFTRGTTESLNLLAYTLPITPEKTEIVLSELEHHANIVPWQQLAKRNNMTIKWIPITAEYELDMNEAKKIITKRTAIVAITHVSNALGTINDVKTICQLAKKNGAISVIDGAQSIAHTNIDVGDIGCDFFAFSGHKIGAPTGVGVLFGRFSLLEKMEPFQTGGNMIATVDAKEATWNKVPFKFEAGTMPVAQVIGLGKAIEYIQQQNLDLQELTAYAVKQLQTIPQLKIVGPKKNAGIISFVIANIHAHDIASLVNDDQICIRAGHHCCMPLMKKMNVSATCRISLWLYNTKSDIDKLITSLERVVKIFK